MQSQGEVEEMEALRGVSSSGLFATKLANANSRPRAYCSMNRKISTECFILFLSWT